MDLHITIKRIAWIKSQRSHKTEYYTMLGYARRTLKNYLELMTQKNMKKQNELFKVLETSSHAQTLVDWLSNFTDEQSKEIMAALQNAMGQN